MTKLIEVITVDGDTCGIVSDGEKILTVFNFGYFGEHMSAQHMINQIKYWKKMTKTGQGVKLIASPDR
jgi:hypothetical protein